MLMEITTTTFCENNGNLEFKIEILLSDQEMAGDVVKKKGGRPKNP
jgi:hypothetical protein